MFEVWGRQKDTGRTADGGRNPPAVSKVKPAALSNGTASNGTETNGTGSDTAGNGDTGSGNAKVRLGIVNGINIQGSKVSFYFLFFIFLPWCI